MAVVAGTSVSCGGQVEGRSAGLPRSGDAPLPRCTGQGAAVIFHPAGGHGSSLTPNGRVQADGTFELTTYDRWRRNSSGDYTVTCFWPEPRRVGAGSRLRSDRLKGRYRDPRDHPAPETRSGRGKQPGTIPA